MYINAYKETCDNLYLVKITQNRAKFYFGHYLQL